MGDASLKSPWWEVPTFDPRKQVDMGEAFDGSDEDDEYSATGLNRDDSTTSPPVYTRRLSLPNMGGPPPPDYAKQKSIAATFASKVLKLCDQVSMSKEEVLELRQEASDLQEYSNAKIGRVTRYLGVLAEKARKLDQVVLESEARLSSLRKERKKLFDDLLGVKGNIRVHCRVRPQFEHEGPTATEFPDDFLIRINTFLIGVDAGVASKKEFEFDRVYGPHVGQACHANAGSFCLLWLLQNCVNKSSGIQNLQFHCFLVENPSSRG